jgi:hypothetical protein
MSNIITITIPDSSLNTYPYNYTISGLTPGATYSFNIIAVFDISNSIIQSMPSNTIDATPSSTPPPPPPPPQPSTQSWKQVVYAGYSMSSVTDYQTLISNASNAGITHVIFDFIVIGDNFTYGWDDITIVDNASVWQTMYSPTNKQYATDMNVKLMVSFGGGTTFVSSTMGQSFSNLWLYPDSLYYLGRHSNNLKSSADALGKDLLDYLLAYELDGIDFDIEWIPTYTQYLSYTAPAGYTLDWSDVYNYLGYLSQYIKEYGNYIVSHAPQTPYFYPLYPTVNNPSWYSIYYFVESIFGNYIDFYNIQYYNNGDYETESSIFIVDESPDWCAAVTQLASVGAIISINDVSSNVLIPVNKIVVGKPSDPANAWPGNIQSEWISLTGYVQNQSSSSSSVLNDWYQTGGIMVWVYRTDIYVPETDYIITYFNTISNSR